MEKIKAVIFDMDGLMIDSEPFHFIAFKKVLKNYGVDLTQEEGREYVGLYDEECVKRMVKKFNLAVPEAELLKLKRKEYRKLLQSDVIAQPGLMDLLKKLKEKGYKISIGSNSEKESIISTIDKLGIASSLDGYTSAEDVKNPKPAPDVYLKAAEKLGVNRGDCLVLEDSPRGVEAAKKAGMICFAIPSNETKGSDFSLADKVLNNLSEVLDLIN